MIELPEYKIIETLHSGKRALVYRAIRKEDSAPVILKTPAMEHPHPLELQRLTEEYELIQKLTDEKSLKAYRIFHFRNTRILELEDIGGVSLDHLIAKGPVELTRFFEIAIQILERVQVIHEKLIIHKDLKPQNIIFVESTGQVQIIDFSISTTLPRFTQPDRNLNRLEGSLPFISPEQSGWTEQQVDYRTDLYTLGVTFYYLLSGRLPFTTEDSLELVYCHLVREPEPLDHLVTGLPSMVWEIIQKLMRKNPEDRYQTEAGVIADLKICQQEFLNQGQIERFSPGQEDFSERLEISSKLYGRESELAALKEAYRSSARGLSEVVFVTGRPGIGKSALVKDVKQMALKDRALFCSGKFEQFQNDSPYSGFVQCIDELITQILTLSGGEIQEWKNRIDRIAPVSARILTDLAPGLKALINSREEASEQTASHTQTQFYEAISHFFSLCGSQDRPLVIFIDDLQWADLSSLHLMQHLLETADLPWALFIGAFRDARSTPNELLQNTIAEIRTYRHEKSIQKKWILPIRELFLEVIDSTDTEALLSDTLLMSGSEIKELSELVHRRTAGNPFFIGQFLLSVYREELIWFNRSSRRWQWSIDQIAEQSFTDNVIRLLNWKFDQLNSELQSILSIAAIIGFFFDLPTLASLTGYTEQQMISALNPAIQENFILVTDNKEYDQEASIDFRRSHYSYRFIHDQIRDTAYARIKENDREQLHAEIGSQRLRRLFKETGSKSDYLLPARLHNVSDPQLLEDIQLSLGDRVFHIVDHLNKSLRLITTPEDRISLLTLNLIAGIHSRLSSGYESSLMYLSLARDLLPEDGWKSQYFLTLKTYRESMESEYGNSNFDQIEGLSNVILENTTDILDQIDVFKLKIISLTTRNYMLEAIDQGTDYLAKLGLNIPDKVSDSSALPHIIRAHFRIGGRIEKLTNRKICTDPKKKAIMELLVELFTPAFISKPALAPVLTMKMVHFTLDHGLTAESAYGFVTFAMILGSGFGFYKRGDRYGKLALQVLEKFPEKKLDTRVLFLYGNMIHHWHNPAREGQDILFEAFQRGLRSGELLFASYALNWYCAYNFLTRAPLDKTRLVFEQHLNDVERINHQDPAMFYHLWYRFVLNLTDPDGLREKLSGPDFDEKEHLRLWLQSRTDTDLFGYFLMRGIIFYLKEDYDAAIDDLDRARNHTGGVFGMPVISERTFYHSLALATALNSYQSPHNPEHSNTTYSLRDKKKRNRYEKIIRFNLRKLNQWSRNSPENYSHKYKLIQAEYDRYLEKRPPEKRNQKKPSPAIVHLYEQALSLAEHYGYMFEQALACERLGDYYRYCGVDFIANAYTRESYFLYNNWGLVGKAQTIRNAFPELLSIEDNATERTTTASTRSSTQSSTMHTLDLQTVIRVSRSISEETDLSRLIVQLIRVVMENAGAARSVLVMEREGDPHVEAVGDKDRIQLTGSVALFEFSELPQSIIQYTRATGEMLLLNHVHQQNDFARDPYFQTTAPESLLSFPIRKQNRLLAILYLENDLMPRAFHNRRLEILNHLTSQVVISMENALYIQEMKRINTDLEQEVQDRIRIENVLRQTLSQKELLLSEIHHRVKNNLNILSSLVFLQISTSTSEEVQSQLERIADRIFSMGLVYERLIESENIYHINMRQYAGDLIKHIVDSMPLEYQNLDIQLEISGITMNIETAIPCGLILNELITNSVQHAFSLDNGSAKIGVSLKKKKDHLFELMVFDTGKGLPDGISLESGGGLGMKIVSLLVKQLRGEAKILSRGTEGGTSYELIFYEITKENERWQTSES